MKENRKLNEGSLSVPLKVEFGESPLALRHAEDVATMRQVLLQITNWFKSNHGELPLILDNSFNDDICNTLLWAVVDFMKKEKEKKND